MRRWRLRVAAVWAASAMAMPSAAAAAAVTVVPAGIEGGEAPSPDGYRVVLEPESGPLPAAAPTFPAGVPFEPPPGRHELWLEGPGTISPAPLLLAGTASTEERPSVLGLPLVPAGVVKLRAAGPGAPRGELHVLHLDGHRRAPALRRPSRRRVSAAIATSRGVLVPAGEVVAGLLTAEGELVGLAGPSRVGGGETVVVAPVPPARGTSDLVAIFDRPPEGGRSDLAEADVEARLVADGGEPVPPRVLVAAAGRIYAMWLGVPSGPAAVTVRTPRARLDETWLRLRSGHAEIVRRPLVPLPSLEVSVRLPPEALALEPFVEVRGRPRPRVVASATVAEETATLRFPHLPFETVEALLKAGPWTWRETVDLTGGPEHRVRFEPWPIHVYGRVLRGSEPIAAEITFHLGGRERVLEVESDAAGEYAATFLRPGRFGVTIDPRRLGARSPPPRAADRGLRPGRSRAAGQSGHPAGGRGGDRKPARRRRAGVALEQPGKWVGGLRGHHRRRRSSAPAAPRAVRARRPRRLARSRSGSGDGDHPGRARLRGGGRGVGAPARRGGGGGPRLMHAL